MPEQTKIVAAKGGLIAAEHWQGPLPPPATILGIVKALLGERK